MNFYPKPETIKTVTKLDKATVAAAILATDGKPKAVAIGEVLAGSDDVVTFNEVWAELETESKSMSQVPKTGSLTNYKKELEKVKKYMSPIAYADAVKDGRSWADTITANTEKI